MVFATLIVSSLLLPKSAGMQTVDAQSISAEIGKLRSLPDDHRGPATKKIAIEIRSIPDASKRSGLASGLANLATEGDFGHDTLQAVADTLAGALKAQPETDQTKFEYAELAALVHYEHVKINLKNKQFQDAVRELGEVEKVRSQADFTLNDLQGKAWTLSSLKGKIVVVNFWATWCPPCKKEMPDMNALYNQYKDQGLVILAISDEKAETVNKYLAGHPVDYTVLLDPGRKVNDAYKMGGIPNSYFYNRKGELAAEAEDMRTKSQFLKLLAQAGLNVSQP